jgi:hypothetical protein
LGCRWSRFNRSENQKSPAENSPDIIFAFLFPRKQIIAAADAVGRADVTP